MVDAGVVYSVPEVRRIAFEMMDLKHQLLRETDGKHEKDQGANSMRDLAERLAGCSVLLLGYFTTSDPLPPGAQ